MAGSSRDEKRGLTHADADSDLDRLPADFGGARRRWRARDQFILCPNLPLSTADTSGIVVSASGIPGVRVRNGTLEVVGDERGFSVVLGLPVASVAAPPIRSPSE